MESSCSGSGDSRFFLGRPLFFARFDVSSESMESPSVAKESVNFLFCPAILSLEKSWYSLRAPFCWPLISYFMLIVDYYALMVQSKTELPRLVHCVLCVSQTRQLRVWQRSAHLQWSMEHRPVRSLVAQSYNIFPLAIQRITIVSETGIHHGGK